MNFAGFLCVRFTRVGVTVVDRLSSHICSSPLLTSHKWRELVSSGRFVSRCHGVFL